MVLIVKRNIESILDYKRKKNGENKRVKTKSVLGTK